MIWKDAHPIVNAARLALLPPKTVYAEIIENADNTGLPYTGHEAIDALLLERNDPLINLGLAEYSGAKSVISHLYRAAKAGSGNSTYDFAVRMACLKNTTFREIGIFAPPIAIELDELMRILQEGNDDEIVTLLSNPNCLYVMSNLFARTAPYDQIPMDRLGRLITASRFNKGLYENYTADLDGGTQEPIWANDIFGAVANLLEKVPVTVEWFCYLQEFLDEVYKNARIYHFPRASMTKLVEILDRWKNEQLRSAIGNRLDRASNLNALDQFRCLIAIFLAPYDNGDNYIRLGESNDVALRCSFYAHGKLSPSEMAIGFSRERDVYLLGAITNDHIYFDNKCRIILEQQIHTRYCFIYKNRCEALSAVYQSMKIAPSKQLAGFFNIAMDAEADSIKESLPTLHATLEKVSIRQTRFIVGMVITLSIFILIQILIR